MHKSVINDHINKTSKKNGRGYLSVFCWSFKGVIVGMSLTHPTYKIIFKPNERI